MDINLNYPTALHQRYVDYAVDFCKNHHISLLLKGSLAKGTAAEHSDIDIVLLCDDLDLIEKFVSGCGNITMSARTQRPKGILIVVYENGICVDLDVRKAVTLQERNEAVILHDAGIDMNTENEVRRIEDITIRSAPVRDDRYQLLRLFHRSLIKTLCGKTAEGMSLLDEIYNELCKEAELLRSGIYQPDIAKALDYMEHTYPISDDLVKLLRSSIAQV